MPVTAAEPRWARQAVLPGFGTDAVERIRAACVVVVGAGGVGSAVLPVLVAAGVGRVVVVDDDVVDATNLSRQTLHAASDVGRAKVESAVESLAALGGGSVTGVRERADATTAAALLHDADLVIDATDSPAARYALDDAAAARRIPLVWGSAQGWIGQVGTAWAARGPRWRDLFPVEPDEGAITTCEAGGVLPSLCTTVGGLMATEALKALTGTGEPLLGRVLVVDALAASVRTIAYGPADAGGTAAPQLPTDPMRKRTPMAAPEIDGPALKSLLAEGGPTQLVDVREPWEAELASLPGSTLIPLGQLQARVGELDRDRPVVAYCHAGVRSADAAAFLAEQGFSARSLQGGIDGWSRTVDPSTPRY